LIDLTDLKVLIRKRLSQKYLGKQAIGLLAERAVRELFPEAEFQVYIKHKILFVRIWKKNNIVEYGDIKRKWIFSLEKFKIDLYVRKREILGFVNKKLLDYGYDIVIRELRTKVWVDK